ncbi:hypothetical protein BDF22DRAFT_696614 [Syncephalis plumigaleata]|nr:hypothetical protein BDF22DRAFT_696614 [Syncephalis plumigaleata]
MYQSNYSNANPNYATPMQQGAQQQQVMNQLVMRPVPGTGPPAGSGPAYGLPTTEPLNFLRPLDQRKFEQLFAGGSLDGLRIAGDAARDILQRSKLSNSALARIWSLADTRNAGSLTFLTMYLTNLAVQGNDIPNQLPAKVRDEVSRIMNAPGGLVRVTDSVAPVNTFQQSAMPPPPPSSISSYSTISGSSNYTNQLQPYQAPALSNTMPNNFMPASSSNANVPWAVTPEEKAAYDQVFSAWDTRGIGFISGETARQIFGQSGLGQSALAQIWQLADTQNHGKLNADEFAVAMHLIHRALAGQPSDLIPPSTRDLSSSVSSLKNSLVQDIVQQRHMSAAYGGKFAGTTSGINSPSGSMRSQYGGKGRDTDDWDSVYRPPRMGDVRKLDDDDLFNEIESSGYRSANRRKPAPRRKADDPWGNLRSTAERYGTSSLSGSGASTPLDEKEGSGRASQETIAELRKQLGEQRILLEALSYSAGDADAQYVTDDERKARDDMREVAMKVRELEKRIAIAEGAQHLLEDKDSEVATLGISLDKMDLSKFTPAAVAENTEGKLPATTSESASLAHLDSSSSSSSKVDAAITASRTSSTYKSSPPVSATSSQGSTPLTSSKASDPDAIKNRAAELLAQRMAALTGKSIPVQAAKPAEPEKPAVQEVSKEPAKDATPTMSSLLASATTKEERQKIIQEQAEKRMKERERFLRETMGNRFPTSPTPSQTASTDGASSNATVTNTITENKAEPANKPEETAAALPAVAGSNNPFRSMATATITSNTPAEDDEAAARRKEEEQAEVERQRVAAREAMLNNAKAARERAQQAEKEALQQAASTYRPSGATSPAVSTATAFDVVKGTEAGRSSMANDRDAIAEAARNARAQISDAFKTQSSESTRSSASEWDMVNKNEAPLAPGSSVDTRKDDVDAAVASATSALFGGVSTGASTATTHATNTTSSVWPGSFEARALYEYTGQNADDLSLAAGDVILVQPCADTTSPWWFARKLKGANIGAEGWFPISYVERLGEGTSTSSAGASSVAVIGRGQILYEFAAQDAGEVSVAAGQTVDVLNRNDPDWWRVRYNGQEGLVPAAYVQLE